MRYLIDGYNLLFRLTKSYAEMRKHQRSILLRINAWAKGRVVTVVFDGRQEAVRGNLDALEIIYTSKDQTADAYILQEVESSLDPSEEMVVSSDREVTGRAKQKGASVESVEQFMARLGKKKTSGKISRDTAENIERLRKIFEAEF